MSTNPGPGPSSGGQANPGRLISRSASRSGVGGRRDSRQVGRRSRQVRVVVQAGNATFDKVMGGTLEISGMSMSFNPRDRLRMIGLPLESNELHSELENIFSQLHEIDGNITKANNSIDELRETTRSVLVEMSQPIA
jgi:hypothetical protein